MHGACILYLPPNLPTTSISAILFQVLNVNCPSLCSDTLGLYRTSSMRCSVFSLIFCFSAFPRHTNHARTFRKYLSDVIF